MTAVQKFLISLSLLLARAVIASCFLATTYCYSELPTAMPFHTPPSEDSSTDSDKSLDSRLLQKFIQTADLRKDPLLDLLLYNNRHQNSFNCPLLQGNAIGGTRSLIVQKSNLSSLQDSEDENLRFEDLDFIDFINPDLPKIKQCCLDPYNFSIDFTPRVPLRNDSTKGYFSIEQSPFSPPPCSSEEDCDPCTDIDQDTPAAALEDGPWYPIDSLSFRYFQDHPNHPNVNALYDVIVDLSRTPEGLKAPSKNKSQDEELIRLCIGDLEPGTLFNASGIITLAKAIVQDYNDRGLIGVLVTVDPNDIDAQGRDIRSNDEKTLMFLIHTVIITEINTIAVKGRFSHNRCKNHPCQSHIVDCSPVQVWDEDFCPNTNLLRSDLLDSYLLLLNRYPGRHTQIQLSPGPSGSNAVLDYLVDEKSFSAYLSASNTGTRQNSQWMEHVGVTHYHLTGRDDIFSFDYSTTNLNGFHGLRASYEAPLWRCGYIRWNVEAAWSEFSASEFGLYEDEFTGNQKRSGLGITACLYQENNLFLDLLSGGRWHQISVNNKISIQKANENFFLPYFGFRFQRYCSDHRISGVLLFEGCWDKVTDIDPKDLIAFGRLSPDSSWIALKLGLSASRFFNPFFLNCYDHIKHEIFCSFDGQYAFTYRLIPQMERVIGGAATVRGYPQSLASGPSSATVRTEYRYHHCICPDTWRAQARVFFDAGNTYFHKRMGTETNSTLLGTGVGLELFYRTILKTSIDWGIALKDVSIQSVNSGHQEVHFSATLVY